MAYNTLYNTLYKNNIDKTEHEFCLDFTPQTTLPKNHPEFFYPLCYFFKNIFFKILKNNRNKNRKQNSNLSFMAYNTLYNTLYKNNIDKTEHEFCLDFTPQTTIQKIIPIFLPPYVIFLKNIFLKI